MKNRWTAMWNGEARASVMLPAAAALLALAGCSQDSASERADRPGGPTLGADASEEDTTGPGTDAATGGEPDARPGTDAEVGTDAETGTDASSDVPAEPTDAADGNSFPEAWAAGCRVQGSATEPTASLDVAGLVALDCGVTEGADVESMIQRAAWALLEAPFGSRARFTNPESIDSAFLPDVMGTYRLQLTVELDGATPSVRTSEVVVHATPAGALHVELVWETPGDPDPSDVGPGAGADLDLHLVHPNGTWCDRVWDCHFRARNPIWDGMNPDSPGNPYLNFDDVYGTGPEIIVLEEPADDLTYRVGVKYYDDRAYGPSDATVRIYVGGSLAWTETRRLEHTGEFWDVATIDWPSMGVTAIDRVTPNVPRPNECLVGR